MKTRAAISGIILCVMSSILGPAPVCLAQDVGRAASEEHLSEAAESLDVYEFPIPWGSAECKALKGYRTTLDAYQIPEEILESISTDGLVQTCLNYPMGIYWTASSMNPLAGIRGVIHGFNGLTELMTRADCGRALLHAYSQMTAEMKTDPLPRDHAFTDWPPEEMRRVGDFPYIELLLCQKEALADMTSEEKSELLRVCLLSEEARGEYAFFESTAILMGRTLLSLEYQPFVQEWRDSHALQEFLEAAARLEPLEEMTELIHIRVEAYLAATGIEGGTEQ